MSMTTQRVAAVVNVWRYAFADLQCLPEEVVVLMSKFLRSFIYHYICNYIECLIYSACIGVPGNNLKGWFIFFLAKCTLGLSCKILQFQANCNDYLFYLHMVTYNNMQYDLPPWSISILPDCKNVAFNTAKVSSNDHPHDFSYNFCFQNMRASYVFIFTLLYKSFHNNNA